MLTGQALHGLLALALAVIAFAGVQNVWPIYAVALLGGMVSALDGPALGRFGAEVVGPEDLSNGLALGSVISSGGRIIGMALAGALIPLTGTGTLFLLNGLSFAGVIAAVLCMRAGEMHPCRAPGPRRSGSPRVCATSPAPAGCSSCSAWPSSWAPWAATTRSPWPR
nr:hypothetical protein GCM10020093_119230 [Planobispora longispora]